MPTYISLWKFTEKGRANVRESPNRVKAAREMLEARGGRVMGVWYTLGDYDLVTISEGPDDETATLVTLGVVRQGNVASVTLRAFTEDEFTQIVDELE
jgi:uncharacterized protein with GYD domain